MNYKIILVDDYFSQLEDDELSRVMSKLFLMKRESYTDKHKKNYLSVAQDDFYCSHVIVVDQETNEFVLAFKIIKYSVCKNYDTKFPLSNYMSGADDIERAKVEKIINKFVKNGHDISYSGGWVVNPKFKGLGLSGEFKEIYTGCHYSIHKYLNLKAMMGVGILDYKTYDFFVDIWGMKDATGNAHYFDYLPYVKCKVIYNKIENVSDYKKEMGEKWRGLWENRVEFTKKKSKIAA
jgi:hypothetical protein